MRNYFGEKIAMYFSFLSVYTISLIPCALIGFPVFIIQLFLGRSLALSIINCVFAASLIFWMALLYEEWKRTEIHNAIKWGQTDFEE